MKAFLAFFLFHCVLVFAGFNQAENATIASISINGNKKTKENTILRELPFSAGDLVSYADTAKLRFVATQNLNNTLLFNFVDIYFRTDSISSNLLVDIKVDERWYIWPGATLSLAETNFNSWWQNKDFDRINYGALVEWYNASGRKDKLTVDLQGGWKRKVRINYYLPNLGKRQNLAASLDLFYANNREINYASLNNERLFFKDQRFIQQELSGIGSIEYRKKLFNSHRISLSYKAVIIGDTVLQYNPKYIIPNHLQSRYLHLSYGFRREKRDNRSYPLKGHLVDLSIDQNGFGIIQKDGLKLGTAAITTNWHYHLKNRWFFAHGLKGKTTFAGQPPYYNQLGLGYTNQFIRGFELFVIDGQHFGLYKSNLKYQIIKKRVIDLTKPRFDRFDKLHYQVFLNLFGDAGYVVDEINKTTNPLANSFQYSGGLGLDFVSYYDIVIRFEGSINSSGQPGFFIHFSNPI
ncbi:MAG: BamA/TamA family outer membrane protein [Salibacteraceae bacterium]|nr:BamA/TamA family outer membrane protein [Salibacteraceae bacterium]